MICKQLLLTNNGSNQYVFKNALSHDYVYCAFFSVCLLTFQGRRMPLKKSGIHMGRTTTSLSSFLASSRSAISALQSVHPENFVKGSRTPENSLCTYEPPPQVPVYAGVTWHNVSLQRLHQIDVVSSAAELLVRVARAVSSPSFALMEDSKDRFVPYTTINESNLVLVRPSGGRLTKAPRQLLVSLIRSSFTLAWSWPPGPAPRFCRPLSLLCCFSALPGLLSTGFLRREDKAKNIQIWE